MICRMSIGASSDKLLRNLARKRQMSAEVSKSRWASSLCKSFLNHKVTWLAVISLGEPAIDQQPSGIVE